MLNDSINKQWKIDFFRTFATEYGNVSKLEKIDKLKFEHFPPVIGNFYATLLDEDDLKSVCEGKLKLSKAKLDDNYADSLVKVDYAKIIKEQLNTLMQQQIAKLHQEDPNFLSDDEKEIIQNDDFPFVRLMTLVYVKDTDEMTQDEQNQWKESMNAFINEQIVFGVVNTYYTMKLYQDNNYIRLFQTPYNREGLWNEYADNRKGFCVAYDFKEISEKTALQLNKLYPVLYADKKITADDLDFDVFNAHCASLISKKQEVHDYDNEWMYIYNHHFTEREYLMLENMLEPIYSKTMNHRLVKDILSTNYLISTEDDLTYDYNRIIEDLTAVLESNEEFKNEIAPLFKEVTNITDDEIEVDFLKPEAIYLGTNFLEDKIQEYKDIIESNNVRIFKIKEKDGKLFKAIV